MTDGWTQNQSYVWIQAPGAQRTLPSKTEVSEISRDRNRKDAHIRCHWASFYRIGKLHSIRSIQGLLDLYLWPLPKFDRNNWPRPYRLSRREECIRSSGETIISSTLDINSGSWQTKIDSGAGRGLQSRASMVSFSSRKWHLGSALPPLRLKSYGFYPVIRGIKISPRVRRQHSSSSKTDKVPPTLQHLFEARLPDVQCDKPWK